jgi:hypothetical protein
MYAFGRDFILSQEMFTLKIYIFLSISICLTIFCNVLFCFAIRNNILRAQIRKLGFFPRMNFMKVPSFDAHQHSLDDNPSITALSISDRKAANDNFRDVEYHP